ncbi:hypothetical protein HDF10_002436 [Edaphobacter lichenicola]|uniref:Core-binding (CB) domain-containing protein n=1 Tax=Tunturiibacter lichenicola TaxID=2051959 RepID=A0A7W8JAL9_9BACT|nr:site-specific integrase [Edaphobacter lichenicola]MBB5344457.1 hypothetical protein [Edaphobacter lichenicola]
MTHLRQIMLEELERRNYAPGTIHAYIRTVEHFAQHFRCSPDKLGPDHIRQYQAAMFRTWKLAPNTVTQRLAALRFLYIQVLKRGWSAAETPYPKKVLRLPQILSQQEVARLIRATWARRSASSACFIPGTRGCNIILMSTVSSPLEVWPRITPVGSPHDDLSSFQSRCSDASSAASSSPVSRPRSLIASLSSTDLSHRSLSHAASPPGLESCSVMTGSSTPSVPSVDPSTPCATSAHTHIASASPTAG